MKKLLTGLLLCTLFVALGAASAMATDALLPEIADVMTSADMAEYAGELDPVSVDYFDDVVSNDETVAFSEITAANGDVALTFAGVLDADGKIVDGPAAASKDLFGTLTLDLTTIDVAPYVVASTDAFWVFDGEDVVELSGDVHEVSEAKIALYPLFSEGAPLWEGKTFRLFVVDSADEVTFAWETTVSIEDESSTTDKQTAIDTAQEIKEGDVQLLLTEEEVSDFALRIYDGTVVLEYTGVISNDVISSADITPDKEADALTWGAFNGAAAVKTSGLVADNTDKLVLGPDGKVYMALQVTAPASTDVFEVVADTAPINNSDAAGTTFRFWVPFARQTGDDYALLTGEPVTDMTVVFGVPYGEDDKVYAAKALSVEITRAIDDEEIADVTSDDVVKVLDNGNVAVVAPQFNADGYEGLYALWTGDETILAMTGLQMDDGGEAAVTLAGQEFQLNYDDGAQADFFLSNLEADSGDIRFDLFLSDADIEALMADEDATLVLRIKVDDITKDIYMGDSETPLEAGTEVVAEGNDTLVITFTAAGDPKFSDLSGTIFEVKSGSDDPDSGDVPDSDDLDPGTGDTPTGGSGGGCSVGSIAPFALLLLAPLALLRK